ncbi:hypothetical protein PCE1_004536 [Barthelona sp. PCE]
MSQRKERKCLNCNERPLCPEAKAEPLCLDCLKRLNRHTCDFCKIDHHLMERDENAENKLCFDCRRYFKRYQEEPTFCSYCAHKACFGGKSICYRCEKQEVKYGSPSACEDCGKLSAFSSPSILSKSEGRTICFWCLREFLTQKRREKSMSRKRTAKQTDLISKLQRASCQNCRQSSYIIDNLKKQLKEQEKTSKMELLQLESTINALQSNRKDATVDVITEYEEKMMKLKEEFEKERVVLQEAAGRADDLRSRLQDYEQKVAEARGERLGLENEKKRLFEQLQDVKKQLSDVQTKNADFDMPVSTKAPIVDVESDDDDDLKWM